MAILVKVVGTAIHNIYFHPLSNYPGPITAAATPLPFIYRLINGRQVHWIQSLHEKYGGVVRIHPSELSFVEPEAWHDIYISRPPLLKPTRRMLQSANNVPTFATTSNMGDHNRMRKILSHAFSDRALKEQEPLIQSYTDLLVGRLQDLVDAGKGSAKVDIGEWYSFTTFDTIGDLGFGESFHSLETSEHHPWVKAIFPGVKIGMLMTIFDHFANNLLPLVKKCLPSSLARMARDHAEFSRQRIEKRINQETTRKDFMTYILENNHEKGITREEIDSTGAFLILAGSETSASTSCSSTWFLLKNPSAMKRLQEEIRGSFTSMAEITLASTAKLPYLHAVIQEALRLHPPAPLSVPREVDRPDAVVCGHLMPVGVSKKFPLIETRTLTKFLQVRVGIPQKIAYRLPQNFVEPCSYLPERWLQDADPKFNADRKDMYEPFSVGPRNCLGKG